MSNTMASNKLSNLIEKYNLTNIIKVIVLFIILFLVYRIFIEEHTFSSINSLGNSLSKNVYEGFTAGSLGNGSLYGNVISLLDHTNIPSYSDNTCIFKLSDTFRIDSLEILLNNNTPATPIPSNAKFYNSDHTISISYLDGNGNTKYLNGILLNESSVSKNSPPTFIPDSTHLIKLTSIQDENSLPIYTSQLIFTVTGNNNKIDTIVDGNGYKYIKRFGIYGGDQKLPNLTTYNSLCNTLTLATLIKSTTTNSIPVPPNQNVITYKPISDSTIYSFGLSINRNSLTPTNTTDKPFYINITYQNSIYPQNVFTINTQYIVRSDYYTVPNDMNKSYIFLTEPIIANSITFTITNAPITGQVSRTETLSISSINALYNTPTASNIADYKQTINLLQSSQDQSNSTNICPSINELVNTQTKTQQICDNMEYQDKVKSEKLRLERNKQYLLKLKNQQEQIDQLNSAIQSLEDKRQIRSTASDQARVLQYQNQKGSASTIRDLANQRLSSQAHNQLFVDANFNIT